MPLSGFGFISEDSDGNEFRLNSSGILFWRKLRLLKNGELIDIIKVNKSSKFPIELKRQMDLLHSENVVFTLQRHHTPSKYGDLRLTWETDALDEDEMIKFVTYAVLLTSIQGSGSVYGSSFA